MRVAICQMNSGPDVEANLICAEMLIAEAATGGRFRFERCRNVRREDAP